MKKIAFFDTKPYDRVWFDRAANDYEITYFEEKLNSHTAKFTDGFDAVCAFVNDHIDAQTIELLYKNGVEVIAMRCAGYSNVDVKAAFEKLHIVRVPAYSPHAVAEHAMGLLLTLNRRLHKAYNRTREFNFSIAGLTGTDLYGKTAGIIGTGKIGRTFLEICRGIGMHVLAYDKFPLQNSNINYVPLDTLLRESDVISLHCPLTPESRYMLDEAAFSKMKKGVFILNTSRGALIDSEALLNALNSGIVGGAGLDVYEEEANLFFEDRSHSIMLDDTLALLVSRPNVLLTAHQAFLTEEALRNIAEETVKNLDAYFSGSLLENEICYLCDRDKAGAECRKNRKERCF